MQYIIAIVTAVGQVAGAINSIYDLSQKVRQFYAEPTDENRQRIFLTYAQVIEARRALLDVCADILSAISALDRRIFHEVLSDKLGDIDQAMQDLDYWRRSGSDAARALALDRSAGAIADMLQYDRSGVYPRPTIVLPFVGMLAARLAILRDADPGFCTSRVARQPVEDGLALIRNAAAEIEALLERHTAIEVDQNIRRQRDEDPLVSAIIRYANVSGTVRFREEVGPFALLDPEYDAAVERARAAAEPFRARGFAEDLARTPVPGLRATATALEDALRTCELSLLSEALQRPISAIERARFGLVRASETLPASVEAVFGGEFREDGRAVDAGALCGLLLNRPATDAEAAALADVASVFGVGDALRLLIGHRDSADAEPETSAPERIASR